MPTALRCVFGVKIEPSRLNHFDSRGGERHHASIFGWWFAVIGVQIRFDKSDVHFERLCVRGCV